MREHQGARCQHAGRGNAAPGPAVLPWRVVYGGLLFLLGWGLFLRLCLL